MSNFMLLGIYPALPVPFCDLKLARQDEVDKGILAPDSGHWLMTMIWLWDDTLFYHLPFAISIFPLSCYKTFLARIRL